MVSVIITTCKRAPKIVERAIISVVEQTYRNWELIIIDDSPDSYEKRDQVQTIVQKYSNKYSVSYHQNKVNSGACYSRNRGLEVAKGEYVAFLDDDDEWLPEKLSEQVRAIEAAPENVALVYCSYYRYTDESGEKELVALPIQKSSTYADLMRDGNRIGGMSMPLLKKECVRNVGGFDELMESAQDMDLWLRLAKGYSLIGIDLPLVLYHVHAGEQITSDPKKKIAGLERLNQKNRDYLEAHKEIKWRRQLSLIRYYVLAGKKKEAFAIWKKSAYLCPSQLIYNAKELVRIMLGEYCQKGED